MKKLVLSVMTIAVAALLSPPASAHHAEMCQVQAAKKFTSKSKRVRYVHNCMAAHPHDRENAKR